MYDPKRAPPSRASAPLALLCASLIGLTLGSTSQAQAQTEGTVPLQQFQPTDGASGGFNHLWGAGTLGHLRPSFGLFVNQAVRPLILVNETTGEEIDLVRYHTQVDVLAGIGLGERFQFSVALPVTPFITQGPDGTYIPEDIQGAGLGDVRLGASARILGDGAGFNLGAVLLATLPTGDTTRYLGNGGVTVEPRLVAQLGVSEALTFGANVGFVYRTDESTLSLENAETLIAVGNEITYGLGAVIGVSEGLDLIGEAYGRAGLGETVDGSNYPLELDVSARKWLGGGAHALTFGVGTGLIAGYGSPNLRVLAGYAFAPAPKVDTDGDGFFDDEDSCIDDPEDVDAYQDEDGCPDPDNDGDGILDASDSCPNKAEDKDGWEDEDGCPDLDDDGDGLADSKDKCPRTPEDKDGFQDEDGCPDLDNDRDGFPDTEDQCPLEAEVINGVDDEDGCPDEGESAVEVTDTHIRILQKVFFKTASDEIEGKSFNLLNQVALTLRAHPELTLVEVEGHTDDVGNNDANLDLSQRRAASVKTYLVGKGIDAERLQSVGYGETQPLKPGKSKGARAANRRVEFRILEVDGRPAGDAPESGGVEGTMAPEGPAPMEQGAADPMKGDAQKEADAAKAQMEADTAKAQMEADAAKAQMEADAAKAQLEADAAKAQMEADAAKAQMEADAAMAATPVSPFSGKKSDFKVITYYAEGSSALDARSQGICEMFAAWMAEDGKVNVKLQGFTDDVGDPNAELAISTARSEAMKACLVERGVAANRIIVDGNGAKWPKAPNDTDAHRAENRRVRLLPVTKSGNILKALPVELKVAEPSF